MVNKPIGIFDSGLGGLTVVKEIMKLLPFENIVYFGDTAHLPYGTKSKEVVSRLSINNVKFLLLRHNIKILVIACNTASALSLDKIKKELTVPVVNVIEPGVKAALNITKNYRIGVIGTRSTIKSKVYYKLLRCYSEKIKVFSKPCSLFVPLVEEGWINKDVTYDVAKIYLTSIKQKNIDTLILGCTHYPLLKGVIKDYMGDKVNLIDSAKEVAYEVRRILEKGRLLNNLGKRIAYKFFVSDLSPQFKKTGSAFLGRSLNNVKVVKL